MKLIRLELKAFGPFTGRTLEFASQDPGLHIIFGPNEAGKSSSLRALKALLYGFHPQTPDNFIHSYDALQVGGSLLASDGKELSFWRRKKRKADLLDEEGNPMDGALLAKFTHGIELPLFESLYGIDHETLVQGGEDILAQRGEVGQALFAAGAGISSLRKILTSLETDGDELFKPQGKKQLIPQAIKKYKELKKSVNEASLSSTKWLEHNKRLKNTKVAQEELEKERKHKESESLRLERLRKIIPELAQLNNLKEQLSNLGEVVQLPLDFPEQLAKTERDKRDIDRQYEKDRNHRKKLLEQQQNISFNQAVLDNAERIEDLHQRLGEYRKGQQDIPMREGSRHSHKREAALLLKQVRADLPLEEVESLRPVLTRKKNIQRLSSQHESLTQQSLRLDNQIKEAEQELKILRDKLSKLPPLVNNNELLKVIKNCSKYTDIDQQIDTLSRLVTEKQNSSTVMLERLGLWDGTPEQIGNAPFPLPETVRRFDSNFSTLKEEQRQLKKDQQKAEDNLKAKRLALKEIQYSGKVPTEQDLMISRERREKGWQLLQNKWLNGADISSQEQEYGSGQPLHEAYEKRVEDADLVADRLRWEADRVAKSGTLRAGIENLEETILELDKHQEELKIRKKDFLLSWEGEWRTANINPRPPKEMLTWLIEIDKLRINLTDISHKQNELTEKKKARNHYRLLLLAEPAMEQDHVEFSGQELTPVLNHAEMILETLTKNNNLLEKLSDQTTLVQRTLDKGKSEQNMLQEAMVKWHTEWENGLAVLGLQQQISPMEALDLLETVEKCFTQLEKANGFQKRIKGLEKDGKKFTEDVNMVLAETELDVDDLSPDLAVLQLHAKLGEARNNRKLLKTNRQEVEELTMALAIADKEQASLKAQMDRYLQVAKCDGPADLAKCIRISDEYRRLDQKISETKISLARLSEGIELEQIQREADLVHVDELPGQIASLKREIEEDLYPRIKDYSQIIGEEKKELQLMDGSGRAAAAAEEMEQIAARVRRLVDDYTKIKLAGHILKGEIERYREEHQDPVLRVASRYFANMTIGSFSGLRTDINDKGEPVLVGVRPDDSRLTVEGMSSGTRDQHYLALRLATLEWRLEAGEPMPFIVDDILINFDDERSGATLKALANLAEKNQVILFTHHSGVVEEASKISAKGSILIHKL